jgi:preprotein translocase subunit SecA
VVNDQRKAVFEQRQEFLEGDDMSDVALEMRHDAIDDLIQRHMPPKTYAEQWDVEGLDERVRETLSLDLPLSRWAEEEGITPEDIAARIVAAADARWVERERQIGPDQSRSLEKNFLLQTIDLQWREHLMHLDHLRNVIGLRSYGQRDPLNEYKTEAFSLFEKLLADLRQNVTRWLMTVEFRYEEPPPLPPAPVGSLVEVHMNPQTGENERELALASAAAMGAVPAAQRQALPTSALPGQWERTSRNAPCPCGSGKKFKHCHGSLI